MGDEEIDEATRLTLEAMFLQAEGEHHELLDAIAAQADGDAGDDEDDGGDTDLWGDEGGAK